MASQGQPDISREIAERARALGEALARDPVVERWRRARQAVEEREATRIMLRDLHQRRAELLRRQAAGETVGEEEWRQFRQLVEVVGYNPYVRELWEAEGELAQLLDAVGDIIQRSAGLMPPTAASAGGDGAETGTPADGQREPGASAGAEGGPGPSPRLSVARSRLWVPGQP